MPAQPPTIYLIAGCNGAGKTTFAREFLPKEVKCLRFLNADEIARGLSPFDPGASAVKAARLLLEEVHGAVRRRETFALESTLSGKTYIRFFREALAHGFEIELHYLWLSSPAQAIARVRQRVKMGGTTFPLRTSADASGSIAHLLGDYLPLATRWMVWDSRGLPAKPRAISSTHDRDAVRKLIGA